MKTTYFRCVATVLALGALNSCATVTSYPAKFHLVTAGPACFALYDGDNPVLVPWKRPTPIGIGEKCENLPTEKKWIFTVQSITIRSNAKLADAVLKKNEKGEILQMTFRRRQPRDWPGKGLFAISYKKLDQ